MSILWDMLMLMCQQALISEHASACAIHSAVQAGYGKPLPHLYPITCQDQNRVPQAPPDNCLNACEPLRMRYCILRQQTCCESGGLGDYHAGSRRYVENCSAMPFLCMQ